MYAPEIVTAPTETPVSIAELKLQLVIEPENTDDDELLATMITAATDMLDGWDGYLGRALMPQVWKQTFPVFGPAMRLPLGPLLEIEGFTYVSTDGAVTAFTDYTLSVDSHGPVLHLMNRWPSVQSASPVTVTFRAGYADAASVPGAIRQAILIQAAMMYRYREDYAETGTPVGIAEMLTRPYRRMGL